MSRTLAALLALGACAAPPPNPAAISAPHAAAAERNTLLADRAHLVSASLVLLGDSITQGWEDAGAAVWAGRLEPRGALNLGVAGDRSEHLLARLASGDYDPCPVRVAVVLIGTNNLGAGQSPEQTAGGVRAVLDDVLGRWPGCRVLLLGIFPRGARADDPLRRAVAATNELLRGVADRDRVTWLDMGDLFVAPDGSLPPEIMPDALHLSARGYALWADALEEPLARLQAP